MVTLATIVEPLAPAVDAPAEAGGGFVIDDSGAHMIKTSTRATIGGVFRVVDRNGNEIGRLDATVDFARLPVAYHATAANWLLRNRVTLCTQVEPTRDGAATDEPGDYRSPPAHARKVATCDAYAHVIVATHVPPFPEATWHNGRTSDPDFLPWYCNVTLGEALAAEAWSRPTGKITVLCGHTHGQGSVEVLPNLTCLTGGSEYGAPRIARVLDLGGAP